MAFCRARPVGSAVVPQRRFRPLQVMFTFGTCIVQLAAQKIGDEPDMDRPRRRPSAAASRRAPHVGVPASAACGLVLATPSAAGLTCTQRVRNYNRAQLDVALAQHVHRSPSVDEPSLAFVFRPAIVDSRFGCVRGPPAP